MGTTLAMRVTCSDTVSGFLRWTTGADTKTATKGKLVWKEVVWRLLKTLQRLQSLGHKSVTALSLQLVEINVSESFTQLSNAYFKEKVTQADSQANNK